ERDEPFGDFEMQRTVPGGSVWVSISGEPVFDAQGRFRGYRGVGKDITERKRVERLRALEHAVSRSIASAETAAQGLRAVICSVCDTTGWECGRYFGVDERAGVLRFSDGWGIADAAIERFIEASRELVY